MPAQNQDFELPQGDDRTIPVTVTNEDTGALLNLSGMTIRWWFALYQSGEAIVKKGNGAGETGLAITDAGAGVFTITLDSADTEGLSGYFYHEAEITDVAGKKRTILTGQIHVKSTTVKAPYV